MNYNGRVFSLFYLEELLTSEFNKSKCSKYTDPDTKEIYVLIPKGLSSGIIIPCIVDTMKLSTRIQENKNLPEGIKGTIIIDDKVVRFLDYKILFKKIDDRI